MRTIARQPVGALACLAAVLLAGGCDKDGKSGGLDALDKLTLDNLAKKLIGPSPSQYREMAFDPNDPDRRRQGIIGLSKKERGLKEPYLRGYAAILKTDREPLVRAAAVRALGKARDPNYIEDVARALFDRSDAVRHDAAVALDGLTGAVAVEPLRNRAVNDTDQDVRAAAARALRHYRRDDVVRALVECLADRQFGVRHEAHASLVALVGQDRGYEPQDWGDVTLKGLPPPKPPEKGTWWDRLWRKRAKPSPEPPTSSDHRAEKKPPGHKGPEWWDRLWRKDRKPPAPPATRPAA